MNKESGEMVSIVIDSQVVLIMLLILLLWSNDSEVVDRCSEYQLEHSVMSVSD